LPESRSSRPRSSGSCAGQLRAVDPVWFFSSGAHTAPVNFAGRVGAFLAELSFQLFGYASYLIPAVMVISDGTTLCRSLDAPGTKATGAVLWSGASAPS